MMAMVAKNLVDSMDRGSCVWWAFILLNSKYAFLWWQWVGKKEKVKGI